MEKMTKTLEVTLEEINFDSVTPEAAVTIYQPESGDKITINVPVAINDNAAKQIGMEILSWVSIMHDEYLFNLEESENTTTETENIMYHHYTAEEIGEEMFVACANDNYDGVDTVGIQKTGENEFYYWTFGVRGDINDMLEHGKFLDFLLLHDDCGYSCGSFQTLEELAKEYRESFGKDKVFDYLMENMKGE